MNMSVCCDSNCKLRPGALCDPTSSVCCSPNCTAAPATQRCWDNLEYLECRAQGFCNGRDVDICPDGDILPDNEVCGDKQVCEKGSCVSMCARATALAVSVENDCHCQDQRHGVCQVCCVDVESKQCIPLSGGVSNLTDGLSCPMGICENGECRNANFLAKKKTVENKVKHFTVLAVMIVVTPCAALILIEMLVVRLFDFIEDMWHIVKLDTDNDATVIDKSRRRKSDHHGSTIRYAIRAVTFKDRLKNVSSLEIERSAMRLTRKKPLKYERDSSRSRSRTSERKQKSKQAMQPTPHSSNSTV